MSDYLCGRFNYSEIDFLKKLAGVLPTSNAKSQKEKYN